MKKIYIVLSLVLASTLMNAQNQDTKSADALFIRYQYITAADMYKDLAVGGKGSPYVYSQIAECFYNVYNYKEAIQWYAKAIEMKQPAETYFKYSQMLKAAGKYEEANKQMQQFAVLAPNDARAVEFKKDPEYLPKLRSQQKLYDVKKMAVNSENSDFGPLLTDGNDFYFTSGRNAGRKEYGWTKEPFLDLYKSVMNADGTFSEPQPVDDINSRFHDGPATLSADGNTMYFASESFRESEYEKNKKEKIKLGQVYIFKAVKTGSYWGLVETMPFNDKRYSTSNPSLSKDGKTLYFSSNMPGGQGGTDIWKVAVTDSGYGKPENLGKLVNTPGKESFPFITDDNKLFFCSDGKKGFGGMDIFMIDLAKKTEAINVGQPVNSATDDFSFSFNTLKNTGFFATNRDGNDDIYQALPVCSVELTAVVKDAVTGKLLADAQVAILDDRKNIIETRTSGSNGEVAYIVDCNTQYTIQVTKAAYESKALPVAKANGGKLNIPADLQPIEKIVTKEQVVLNDIYFEFDKSNVTKEGAFELDKLVQAMAKYPEMIVLAKSHTDSRGSDVYNMSLSDRRAQATVQYILTKGISKNRISGKGYGESEPKVDCKENCTDEQHAQNRRSEFLILK